MYVCIHVATRWGYEQWHSQVTDDAWALLTFVLGWGGGGGGGGMLPW